MSDVQRAPTVRMRRSAELAPLSREHHVALAVALRLRRASPTALAVATERFDAFWREHGDGHFDVEEVVLHDTLLDCETWCALVARMRAEHTVLRRQGAAFLAEPTVERAHTLGEQLRDHVRFEERVLFDTLERRLDAPTRAVVGQALVGHGAGAR
jgi:hypothetical protein